MKTRRFAVTTVLGLALALASAVIVSKPAAAKCYDQNKQPIPCPKTDYQVKQPTATDAPTPTETPTGEPVAQQSIVAAPDAAQLAILCANLPGGTAGGPGNPAANTPSAPPQAGLSPFLLGGGGLLGGILIGLLVPGFLRGFSWGRNVNGDGIVGPDHAGLNGDGIIGPEQKVHGFQKGDKWDKWHKADGSQSTKGFTVKLDKSDAAFNFSKRGEAGMQDFHRGEAGMQDFHQADAGKFAKSGGEAGFTDELRGGNTFNKADDAGFTDEL